jgi:hypothetical protein
MLLRRLSSYMSCHLDRTIQNRKSKWMFCTFTRNQLSNAMSQSTVLLAPVAATSDILLREAPWDAVQLRRIASSLPISSNTQPQIYALYLARTDCIVLSPRHGLVIVTLFPSLALVAYPLLPADNAYLSVHVDTPSSRSHCRGQGKATECESGMPIRSPEP